MLPLLGEVVTDMGKADKTRYFGNLLEGEKLTTIQKDEFVRYYFENRQDQNRKTPFQGSTPAEDREFWQAFTGEFEKYVILRFRLSGTEGTKTAYSADKDGRFTQEATRNLYDLAYRITNDFEKARIEQLIKREEEAARAAGDAEREKKAARDRELLNAGKLKLIMVDGVEEYVSEEDAEKRSRDENQKNKKVTPAVAVGLGKMKDPEKAAASLSSGSAISAAGAAGGAGGAGGVSGVGPSVSEPAKDETAGYGDLHGDYISSAAAATDMKNERLVTEMAENGLTIVPNTFMDPQGRWTFDENGFLAGEVKDRNGQLMLVRINTALGKDDARKFDFTLLEKDGKPMRRADGSVLHFNSSENDLAGFRTQDAMQMMQRTRPDMAKEKPGAPLPQQRPGVAGMPAFGINIGKPMLPGEIPKPKEEEKETKREIGVTPPAVPGIPVGARVKERMPAGARMQQPGIPTGGTAVPAGAPSERTRMPKTGIRPPSAPPGSVRARKDELEARRAQMRNAPAMPARQRPPRPGVAPAAPPPKSNLAKWVGALTAAEMAALGAGAGAATMQEEPTATQETSLLNLIASVSDNLNHGLHYFFIHAAPHNIADIFAHPSLMHGFAHLVADAGIKIFLAHLTGGNFFA